MTRGTVDGTRKKEAIECIKAMQVQEDAEALLYDGRTFQRNCRATSLLSGWDAAGLNPGVVVTVFSRRNRASTWKEVTKKIAAFEKREIGVDLGQFARSLKECAYRRGQQEGEEECEKSAAPIELVVEKIPPDFAYICLGREQGTQRVHRPEAKESTQRKNGERW